ncbi:MAG TPA: hypothetical protein VNW97_13345 [Candidatus Saccharimonadales bacterium]|jgi:tetratricopeptide (TPR) repeat protein|nr:hypothetical protein [Candidatus Saccharimonadales bacterium]
MLNEERLNQLKKQSEAGLTDLPRKVFRILLDAHGESCSCEFLKNKAWNAKNIHDGALQAHIATIRKFFKSNKITDVSIPDAESIPIPSYRLVYQIAPIPEGFRFGPFELRRADRHHILKTGTSINCSGDQRRILEKLLEAHGGPLCLEAIRQGWDQPGNVKDEEVQQALAELAKTLGGSANAETEAHIRLETTPVSHYILQHNAEPIDRAEFRDSDVPPPKIAPFAAFLRRLSSMHLGSKVIWIIVSAAVIISPLVFYHIRVIHQQNLRSASEYQLGMAVCETESRRDTDINDAIPIYQRSVLTDPTNGRAWAEMANAYTLLSMYGGGPPRNALNDAKNACDKAKELSSNIPETKTCVAELFYKLELKFGEADKAYKAAIDLDPKNFRAHHYYSTFLAFEGKLGDAYKESLKAQELDPQSKIAKTAGAWILMFMGNYDKAIRELKPLEKADFTPARWRLAVAYQLTDKPKEAIELLGNAEKLKIEQNIPQLATLGYVLARSGNTQKAKAILGSLQELKGQPDSRKYVSAYWTAVVHAGLGERDSVFADLKAAQDSLDTSFPYVLVDPIWSPIRDDQRFTSLQNTLRKHE